MKKKIYNWKADAKREDIEAHLKSLYSAISYYENRGNDSKVRELIDEKNSIINFYKLEE